MWAIYTSLKKRGILSINRRNSDYVLKYNKRKYFPLVDDKIKTKELAQAAKINIPTLYDVIRSEYQIKKLDEIIKNYHDFVIKPAHGAGGDGILVITGRVFGKFRQSNGALIALNELQYHLSSILSGAYSLGGHPDCAIIERLIISDPIFDAISYEGVPDIRIISLLGYPAMAMLRLPTRMSKGKANLHQGAIGVGINIKDGVTLNGVLQNDIINYHPDTLNSISGIKIPKWDEALAIAAKAYDLTNLGYLGVDIVLDKFHGPLMLELNARPGLNIQIANQKGALLPYKIIERRSSLVKEDYIKRVEFSKTLDSEPLNFRNTIS